MLESLIRVSEIPLRLISRKEILKSVSVRYKKRIKTKSPKFRAVFNKLFSFFTWNQIQDLKGNSTGKQLNPECLYRGVCSKVPTSLYLHVERRAVKSPSGEKRWRCKEKRRWTRKWLVWICFTLLCICLSQCLSHTTHSHAHQNMQSAYDLLF